MTECLHLLSSHTDAESHGTDLPRASETGGLCVHHKIKHIMSTCGHVYCCTACDNKIWHLGLQMCVSVKYDKW